MNSSSRLNADLPRSSFAGLVPAVLFLLLTGVLFALIAALATPVYHLDGAFQTAAALARLQDGELPGRDFLPYLGLGAPYALYPAFVLAGGNLHGAQFAAYLGTYVACFILVAVIVHLAQPHPDARRTLVVAVLATAGAFALSCVGTFLTQGSAGWAEALPGALLFQPGNSLRPVRRLIAPFALMVIYLIARSRGRRPEFAYGAVAGLCLLWSNDFGIATAAVSPFILLVDGRTANARQFLARLVVMLLVMMAVGAALLALVSGGHPDRLIRYNLADVAESQWWYFHGYETRDRIFALSDLYRIFLRPPEGSVTLHLLARAGISSQLAFAPETTALQAAAVFAIPGALITALRRQDPALGAFAMLGACLFLAGLAYEVFGHIDPTSGIYSGYDVWALVALLRALAALAPAVGRSLRRFASAPGLSAASLTLSVACLITAGIAYPLARRDSAAGIVAETGTHVGATDRPQIVQLRSLIGDLRNRRATLIEEYWGLASAMGAPRTALPTDSVIHALGAARTEYLKAWDKAPPDIIVTTRPQFAPDWQGWSVSFNWWFYRRVLENYAPHLRSRTTIAWQRRTSPATTTALVCDLHTTAAGPELVIQPEAAGRTTRIADVEVRYSLMRTGPRPLSCLNPPLLFADNRVDQRFGFVSLDGRGGAAAFPVLMRPGTMTKVPFRWIGCGDYRLTLMSCRARAIAELNADTILPPPVPAAPGH